MKYTAPVRRGFLTLLRYLEEDTPHTVEDLQHPMLRRLKQPARSNLQAAITWLKQEGLRQHALDEAKAAAQARAADPEASPPISDQDGGVPDGDDQARE